MLWGRTMAGCLPEARTPCPPSSTPGGGCGVATEPALSEGGSVESDNPSEQPAPKPQGPDSETPSEQATLFSDILGKVLGKIEPAYIKNNTAIVSEYIKNKTFGDIGGTKESEKFIKDFIDHIKNSKNFKIIDKLDVAPPSYIYRRIFGFYPEYYGLL